MRRSEVLPYREPRVVDDLSLRRIGRAMSADHAAPRPRDLDPESAEWVRSLSSGVSGHDEAVGRLHAMLVRAAPTILPQSNGTSVQLDLPFHKLLSES
jgi:hypothetical protein